MVSLLILYLPSKALASMFVISNLVWALNYSKVIFIFFHSRFQLLPEKLAGQERTSKMPISFITLTYFMPIVVFKTPWNNQKTKDFLFSAGIERDWPVNIYLLKFNNRNTRKRCEICSKLSIKTPERRQWRRSGVFTVNFEHISHLFLMFSLLTLNK